MTGDSRFPVKNFLICLAHRIWAGVTGGSLIHSPPGSLQTKYVFLLHPVPFSSLGMTEKGG